jgi:hypothetical protein
MVGADGAVHVIRAAETLEAVTAPERLPAHLADPFPRGLPD